MVKSFWVTKLSHMVCLDICLCINDHYVFVVSLSGWGPALCMVWWVRRVRKGARKKVQLQLHWSSSPAKAWGLWPSQGTYLDASI